MGESEGSEMKETEMKSQGDEKVRENFFFFFIGTEIKFQRIQHGLL